MRIRTLIASDIRLYLEGMLRLLGEVERIELVAFATNAADAIEAAQHHQPDVVLLDMSMEQAYSVARHVGRHCKGAKIVAVCMPEAEVEVISCAEVGIAGYVPRSATLDEMLAAMETVMRGEVHCSPKVASFLFRRMATLSADRQRAGPVSGLTVRELQILRLLQQGMSNKMISRSLGIEPPTVKNHVHSILTKLGVHRRAEAVSLLHRYDRALGSESTLHGAHGVNLARNGSNDPDH